MCQALNSFFNHLLKKALSVLDTDLCHMQLLVFVFKDSTCCIPTPKQKSPALLLYKYAVSLAMVLNGTAPYQQLISKTHIFSDA